MKPIPPEAVETMRLVAIQHNGRHKPFDSFAREALDQLSGTPRPNGQDPVVTILSMIADPEAWHAAPLISVPFKPLREGLGMPLTDSRISYDGLLATRKLMRMLPPIVQKQ